MKLKIGICDGLAEWHERLEEILQEARSLKGIAYEVEHFYSGKEVLQHFGEVLHLLFTDVVLKDGSGIALAERMRPIWPECQIVYVTEEVSYALDVYQIEHMYFMLKEQVNERIENVLDKALDRMTLQFKKANRKIVLAVMGGKS